jgi:outer membrane biosynthesis protein TonB
VRYGLIGSIILHIVIFGVVIFNFATSRKDDAPPPAPVSVEIMSPKDYSERQAGKVDGKADAASIPVVVKAPEAAASAKKEVEQKQPAPKAAEKEALLPPPPAPSAPAPPKPVEVAKAEPPAERPVAPAPKPVVKKVAVKPKPEAPKKAEEPPKPELKFDPSRIRADLNKDEQDTGRPRAAQSSMDTPPSKLSSDRQTAVLNRDPNAGAPGGDYDPTKPWRPASSLQDQAMGINGARGAMNAGSCADAVQSRIEQNWDLPIGAQSAENIIVRLRIELNRDGTLLRPPTVMDQSFSPGYQAMAGAAVRAAIRGQPFIIPPPQYEQCRDMILRFNPRDMYGG